MYTNDGVTKEKAVEKPVESGCAMHSLAAAQGKRKSGEEAGQRHKDEDVLLYSCGDENRGPPKDVCFCNDSNKAFRKWLNDKHYKTIQDLNKEWGSQYKTFD